MVLPSLFFSLFNESLPYDVMEGGLDLKFYNVNFFYLNIEEIASHVTLSPPFN